MLTMPIAVFIPTMLGSTIAPSWNPPKLLSRKKNSAISSNTGQRKWLISSAGFVNDCRNSIHPAAIPLRTAWVFITPPLFADEPEVRILERCPTDLQFADRLAVPAEQLAHKTGRVRR